jgi:itaconate CoA-transferase
MSVGCWSNPKGNAISDVTAPLAGVLVVAIEQAVSAPYCTRMLGDLGARVIKIEQPGAGDFTRGYDTAVNGLASYFVWLNRHKHSLTLDFKHPQGAAILHRLLAKADVVVQNLAPGAARRRGLDAEQLSEQYPTLIVAEISGYGKGGPLDHRRAYDLLIQAEAGSCASTGWPSAPAKPGAPLADVGTGMTATIAILAALHDRVRTGRGTALDISLFDVVTDFLGFALLHSKYTGHDRPPNGMSSPTVAPYGAYPTIEGRLVVLGTTNDQEWQRFSADMLDRSDLAEDPSLASNEQRCSDRARIDAEVSTWTTQRSIAEILDAAESCGIGAAVYNSVAEVVAHPQLVTRGRWVEVGSPVGPVSSLLPPFTNPDWPMQDGPVPALGEHTDAILGELGFTDDEIAALRTARVV